MTSTMRCNALVFALSAVLLPLGCGKDDPTPRPAAATPEGTTTAGGAPVSHAPVATGTEPSAGAPTGMRMGSSAGGGDVASPTTQPQGNAAAPAPTPPPAPVTAPAPSPTDSSASSGGVGGGGTAPAPTDSAAQMAQLAAQPKFAQFVAMATERHEAMLAAASFRLRTRGRDLTDAENAERKRLDEAIGKAGERMGTVSSRPGWTQEDYLVMDYIVGELIRTRPPGS